MVVKTVSSRASIIGRGAKCRGKSAVEQSAYISRTTLYSEYYGEKFYPKAAEDLVSTGVMLPDHAPREYMDHSVLWNSVEKVEKHSRAQLCRLNKYSLPNWMSYELADKFVRDFINRNFVSKGMCAEYAIHDSVNEKGERNLHVHILLTMRPILENGEWGEKSRKVYKYDKDGNKIKKKNGRYDCTTEKTTDWDDEGNAKKWRQDLVESINKVAEEIGIEDERWEWKSFKDRGLDIKPTIHLGEKASALERKGIHTDKGDYNREVRYLNSLIVRAVELTREKVDKAVSEVKQKATTVVKSIKNEIMDMIREVAERNANRLNLPVRKGKYITKITDRGQLQKRDFLERMVHDMGWTTFEEMNTTKKYLEKEYDDLLDRRTVKADRINYLYGLLEAYKDLPYQEINAEYWKLKNAEKNSKGKGGFLGFAKKSVAQEYKLQHQSELNTYRFHRDILKDMIKEDDKTIRSKAWQKEFDILSKEFDDTQKPFSQLVWKLSAIEVLEFNRKELVRMLENEGHQKTQELSLDQKRKKPAWE